MYELFLKNGKVFTSKSVGTGPSSYEKRIYRPAVSQRLRNTDVSVAGRSFLPNNIASNRSSAAIALAILGAERKRIFVALF